MSVIDLSCDTVHRILTEDPVLCGRRRTVERYMRAMATMIWRCPEDILYTTAKDTLPEDAGKAQLRLQGGRLYRGIPYSFACCSRDNFLDLTGEPDEAGIYHPAGLNWQLLSGTGATTARMGNDCSSSVTRSWSQIGAQVPMTSTQFMVRDKGFLPVGDYRSNPADNTNSDRTVAENGKPVMFEAYAKLQTGDAVVCRAASSGHVMLAVEVRVVRDSTGAIDGQKSTLTVLEQSREFFWNGENWFDETLGEQVWAWYGVDKVYTFDKLFEIAYLPITCAALTDPTPIGEPELTDSETVFDKTALCRGTVACNWMLDRAVLTISDTEGRALQQGAIIPPRNSTRCIDLERFRTEAPERMQGRIDPEILQPGRYRCTLTVRLTTGQELTVRDFDFEI